MRTPSLFWATVLVALPLTAAAMTQDPAGTNTAPQLFQTVPNDVLLPLQSDDAALRQRNVLIDWKLLGTDDPAVGEQVDRVTLNLFDDLGYTGIYESMEATYGGGTIVTYRIEEDPYGYAWFSLVGDALAATVRADNILYKVGCVGEGQHTVSEIDENAEPYCGTPDSGGGPQSTLPFQKQPLPPWYEYTIDVMVVYTTDAKNANGGDAGMTALINLAMYETNQGYSQSDVLPRVNIVHCEEVGYTETGNELDYLYDMHDPGDGQIDFVHNWRDEHGADVVVGIYDSGGYCGVAMGILCSLDPTWDTEAFCVVKDSCATGYFSFGHEIGHLQGAHHEYAGGSSCEVTPWPYAYRTPSAAYRTIMCYAPGTRILFWSNPAKLAPNGEALGASGSEENWDTLNYTATTVSGWRATKNYGHNLLTQFNSNNGYAGNMFDLEPKTDISFNSFDINVAGTVGDPVTVDLWYKVGGYSGHEDSSLNWVYVGNGTGSCADTDNYTHVYVPNNLVFHGGEVYGIYVDLTSYGAGQTLRYTSGGPSIYEDGFVKLTTGVGKAQGFGGSTFYYREWNGRLHYYGALGTKTLSTTFASDNGYAGSMFDVYAKKDLTINAFDVNVYPGAASSYITVDVWYKTGSYVGSETNSYDWTFVGTDYKAVSYGKDMPTRITVGDIDLQAGTTYGFYLHLDSYPAGQTLQYTNGSTDYENYDLKIYSGIGRDEETFSGSIFSPRIWNGTIRYSLGAWTDLGYALGGYYGDPSLAGSGSLMPGEPMSLNLTNTLPSARCFLLIGTSTWYAKFSGGVMVPAMDMFQIFKTDRSGSLLLKTTWPPDIPQGMPIYFQYWIFDKAGPKGFAASNALQATTQ